MYLTAIFSQSFCRATFTVPDLPPGFAPFNILEYRKTGCSLTYCLQDEEQGRHVSGPGNGFVDVV